MTIPTLISRTQEKVAVARLKKTYSALESAFRLAVAENGTPDNWNMDDSNSNMTDILIRYMKIIKNCQRESACLPQSQYRYIDGSPYNANYSQDYTKFQLADGSIILGLVISSECTSITGFTKILSSVCGHLYVDINGYQKPNQWGVDYFMFYLTKYGIMPVGTEDDKSWMANTYCLNKTTGVACTAWVLYNENMDYLHCSDLSWGGKTKCK